jgi:protein-tyrosine phosphatase
MRPAQPSGVSLLQGVPNFRDLGGLVNAEGRPVRRGLVYRSEVLAALDDQDLATLAGLRIGTVFDLRNPSERAAAGTLWPGSGDAVQVRVMPEELLVPGADMRQFLRRLREATLDVGQISELMLTTYRAMPTHFGGMLRQLFDDLVQGRDAAALVHCTAGKDRTGFVCAMLLSALDVPADTVMLDYLATARYYTVERLLVHLQQAAGRPLDPAMAGAMAELAQVKAEYLEVALAEIERGWGTVSAYLLQQAGLDDAMRRRLHARFLEY